MSCPICGYALPLDTPMYCRVCKQSMIDIRRQRSPGHKRFGNDLLLSYQRTYQKPLPLLRVEKEIE